MIEVNYNSIDKLPKEEKTKAEKLEKQLETPKLEILTT